MTEYTFFARKAERWGKDMMSLWGSLNICPHLNYLELLCHSSGELLSISSLKIWGTSRNPATTWHISWFAQETLWRLRIMAYPGLGKSQSSPGIHHGGGGRNTVCLHLQQTRLALCPCTAVWGLQPHTPSQGQAFGCPTSGKGGGEPLWLD